MDALPPQPASASPFTVAIPPDPLSPWLRLAHRTAYPAPPREDVGRLRRIADFLLLLQVEGTNWLWWGPGNGSVELPAGAVALVPPQVLHAHGEHGVHYAVHFDLLAQPRLADFATLHYVGGTVTRQPLPGMPAIILRQPGPDGGLCLPLVSRPAALRVWRHRCERLAFLYRTRTHRGLAATCEALEILLWAIRSLGTPGAQAAAAGSAQDRVLAAIASINGSGLARRLTTAGLARQAGLGHTAFYRAFRTATGMTPRAYLESRRVELAARRLLETQGVPIAAIAEEVGFADAFHFSRVFRRVTGHAPRAYRRAFLQAE